MIYPLFNPRGCPGYHFHMLRRAAPEPPSQQVLLEMEVEGLRADALRGLVDGMQVKIFRPDTKVSPTQGGQHAGGKANNMGIPPEADLEEEFYYDEGAGSAADDCEGPTRDEEEMANEMDYESPPDVVGCPTTQGPYPMMSAGLDCGAEHAPLLDMVMDDPTCLAGTQADSLLQHNLNVSWLGSAALPSWVPLFPHLNVPPARPVVRRAPPRKAHTKRQVADDSVNQPCGPASVCGRQSDSSWMDKVNSIFDIADSGLDSDQDSDFLPHVSKRRRGQGNNWDGVGSCVSGGAAADDSEETNSTEDSDTGSDSAGSWDQDFVEGVFNDPDEETFWQGSRWDDGPVSFMDDMASEEEAERPL